MQLPARAATNHNTGAIKLLAIACMIADHTGVILFPSALWLRYVGRLAFPLFAWCVAVGAEHTRDIRRYALRLFLVGIASQPFYMFALNHPLSKPNIFCTLLLGLFAIWGLKTPGRGWLAVIAALLGQLCVPDYGVRGVLCIVLLWLCMDKPLWLALCFSLYCVVWGEGGYVVWKTDFLTLRMQMIAICALPVMLWPSRGNLKTPRGLMYAAYSGHLFILWAIKNWILA